MTSNSTTKLEGPRFGPIRGNKPKQLFILLHGVGADGQDLIELAPTLSQAFPDASFVSPNAPYACDMAMRGYQWFSLQDRSPEKILSGVKETAPILNDFIDDEMVRYGVNSDQTVLLGFSQGTMMGLFVAPRRKRLLAGVVGFSGRLIAPKLLEDEVKSHPPVLLVHGDADEVVPVDSVNIAKDGLIAAGIKTAVVIRPGLGHGIDMEGIKEATTFLNDCFKAKKS